MDLNTLGELKDRLNLSGMGKPAVIGVVAVVVAVAVLAGMRFAGTATADEFELSRSSASEEQAQAEEQDGQPLYVHVSGSVANPGLYELEPGARVADAVDAAGGFSEDAATGSVNLARPIDDGEQISVASQGQPAGTPPAEGEAVPTAAGASPGLLNINTASAVELTSLPGVGEATAAKIVADRQANGPYKAIEDLKRVSGVGDKKFEAIRGLICV